MAKFKDKITLNLLAGKGGRGAVTYINGRKPHGGMGGRGGNIYLEGSTYVYDLNSINTDFTIKAENGRPGGDKNQTGADGKDVIIKVPLTTNVYDKHHRLITSINKHELKALIAKGGQGGMGNYFYRTKGLDKLDKFQPGEEGETLETTFELELYSDILLIGFPNAGKSSLLNSITNAQSKVASYAFTTLNPQLGRLNGYTIMDLPGLIEGTYEGKGLGTSFVKHTKSAQYVAHLISLETQDIAEEYKKIRTELKNIDEDLANKPEVLILTKTDLVKPDEVAAKIKIAKKLNKNILTCSMYDLDSLEAVKEFLIKNLNQDL